MLISTISYKTTKRSPIMWPSHHIGKLQYNLHRNLCPIYVSVSESQGMKNYDLLVICIWYSQITSTCGLRHTFAVTRLLFATWYLTKFLVPFSRTLQALLVSLGFWHLPSSLLWNPSSTPFSRLLKISSPPSTFTFTMKLKNLIKSLLNLYLLLLLEILTLTFTHCQTIQTCQYITKKISSTS